MASFLTSLATSLWTALEPLALAMHSTTHLRVLLRRHGWDADVLSPEAMPAIRNGQVPKFV